VGVVESVTGDKAQCKPGSVVVRVDPRYFRPTEVETLLGDAGKARQRLGWQPETSFGELVREMSLADLANAQRDAVLSRAGLEGNRFNA
jgi:GDPmannose 4,6-dehydratase